MLPWLLQQWEDIKGNFKFWLICLIGGLMVAAAVAITRGLLWWQQAILVLIFLILFGWAVIASYTAHVAFEDCAPTVTAENVESHIRDWLDHMGISMQKVPDPKFKFLYRI